MRFIISIFLLLSTNAAFCCCNSYAINIYPFKKEISENSIFIIGYNTDLYKFNVEKLIFKAKTLNGNLLDLKIKKKYLIGSEAQIILSCSKNFTLNDSISILVEKEKSYNTDTANILKFISQVEYEKWFVKNKKDTEKPRFTNKATTYRPISMSSTSIEGFRVLVNCDVTDNSINTATNLDSTHIYYPIFL